MRARQAIIASSIGFGMASGECIDGLVRLVSVADGSDGEPRQSGARRARIFSSAGKESDMTNQRMRTLQRRFAVCAVVLCFAAALAAQTPEWKSYSYPADGFSASFPSQPELQKKDVPTDAGSFQLRSYIAQDGAVAMFIGVCDYGAQAAGKDPESLLQGAKNGALQNTKSHLVSEQEITLGVYHGVQFEAESDAAHFSARVYMVGTTLYQALVVSQLGKPYPDTARFLDSFQLIARTSN